MAVHVYSISKSAQLDPSRVVVGTSSTGAAIELSTLDGAGLTRMDVLSGLRTLVTFFEKAGAPVTP